MKYQVVELDVDGSPLVTIAEFYECRDAVFFARQCMRESVDIIYGGRFVSWTS
jgi:hypothetical protein